MGCTGLMGRMGFMGRMGLMGLMERTDNARIRFVSEFA